jgi:hypothetical protein
MKVPCESREEPEICAGKNERDFSEDSRKSSGKLRERWKKIRRPRHTIYMGGGFQEPASIRPLQDSRRMRVHSDVPRVTFFTRVRRFSWKRIVGVNPPPRGASVGELSKTLPPSKCRIVKIHETSSQSNYRKKVYICEKRWSEES